MVLMITTVLVAQLNPDYIKEPVSIHVQVDISLNLETVTKSVTNVTLLVNLVTLDLSKIVLPVNQEDTYIWDNVLKFAQPNTSLTPTPEPVTNVTKPVVNVPDNTNMNVPNVMNQDT
jgi:hypothetical protein